MANSSTIENEISPRERALKHHELIYSRIFLKADSYLLHSIGSHPLVPFTKDLFDNLNTLILNELRGSFSKETSKE